MINLFHRCSEKTLRKLRGRRHSSVQKAMTQRKVMMFRQRLSEQAMANEDDSLCDFAISIF
jgi:hypothetical protein